MNFVELEKGEDEIPRAEAALADASLELPETVEWHSGVVMRDLGEQWKTIYHRDEKHPVVAESSLGKGEMVVMTDSYLFSNEAMQSKRNTAMLRWVIGDNTRVLIDETHHGVETKEGVMTLARAYGLETTFLVLIAAALLFVWRNASPLLPVMEEDQLREKFAFDAAKDSQAGLTQMLRRAVPDGNILETCFEEWRSSLRNVSVQQAKCIEAMQTVLQAYKATPPKVRNAAETYEVMASIWKDRTRGGATVAPSNQSKGDA